MSADIIVSCDNIFKVSFELPRVLTPSKLVISFCIGSLIIPYTSPSIPS